MLIDYYGAAFTSESSQKITGFSIAHLPINLDFAKAIALKQEHILLYLPLSVLWWIALADSMYILLKGTQNAYKKQFAIIIILLISSSLCSITLGRLHTHKVMFISTGVTLWLCLRTNPLQLRRSFKCLLLGGLSLYYIGLTFLATYKQLQQRRILGRSFIERRDYPCYLSRKLNILNTDNSFYKAKLAEIEEQV